MLTFFESGLKVSVSAAFLLLNTNKLIKKEDLYEK